MANPDRQNAPDIDKSEQEVLNKSFDKTFNVLAVESLNYNPATGTLDRADASGPTQLATRIDDSATPIIYIGKAPIASGTSSAVWQVVKLDTTSGLVKTFADGNASFDNVWDNRASLTYN